jgi:hypothetical protein
LYKCYKWLTLLVAIIVPRILENFSLTPKSSSSSTSEINKHPGGQPPAKIISTLFKRLEKEANTSGCYDQKRNYCPDPEGNGLRLEGLDNVLLRLDRGLAPVTFGEDVWLVGSNSSSSSWDVKALLMSSGVV